MKGTPMEYPSDIDSPYFNRREFACKCGCGFATVDARLLNILEYIRTYFNEPVRVHSASRCASHNANEGGSPNSKHLQGIAADISMRNTTPTELASFARDMMNNWGGIGEYKTFVHIDVRPDMARWHG